jgi:hypothetical protein
MSESQLRGQQDERDATESPREFGEFWVQLTMRMRVALKALRFLPATHPSFFVVLCASSPPVGARADMTVISLTSGTELYGDNLAHRASQPR